MLFLRRITQRLVIIDPPEKLVLEVDSAGAYSRFRWVRNGADFSDHPTAPFPITGRFFYFTEAYVREPTAEEDLGLYDVDVAEFGGTQSIVNAPRQFFVVVPYGKPLTVAVYFAGSATKLILFSYQSSPHEHKTKVVFHPVLCTG